DIRVGVLIEEEVEKGKLCVRSASQCLRQSIMIENWDRTSFHRAIYSLRNCLPVIWPSFCNPTQSVSQSFEPSIKCKQKKAGWGGGALNHSYHPRLTSLLFSILPLLPRSPNIHS
ncbi:hypothetical protein WUBG_17099, partial [Wuchereria bancrofti]